MKSYKKETNIHFKQHIPSFCEGFVPEEYTCESLEELLKRNKNKCCKKDNEIFACSEENDLMVSSTIKKSWWVLGSVSGIDLQKYLPHYDSVCLLKGDNIKIVKGVSKEILGWHDDAEYLVAAESDGSYSLVNLTNFSDSWAWAKKEDYPTIRYATQEELDKLNNYYKSKNKVKEK